MYLVIRITMVVLLILIPFTQFMWYRVVGDKTDTNSLWLITILILCAIFTSIFAWAHKASRRKEFSDFESRILSRIDGRR